MIRTGKKYKAANIGLLTTFKSDLSLNISLKNIGLVTTIAAIASKKYTIKKLKRGYTIYLLKNN